MYSILTGIKGFYQDFISMYLLSSQNEKSYWNFKLFSILKPPLSWAFFSDMFITSLYYFTIK